MICLVTGGAGFIGSHLALALVAAGHRVTVVDDLSSGKRTNLPSVKRAVRLKVVDLSRQNRGIDPLFNGVDWVFHLAGRADIVPSILYPADYHRVNVTGTVNVLESSRRAGVKRFIYAASSTCYGIPDVYPTAETAPARPMFPYALTKYIGEQYILHWGIVYKLPVVSLRLFNVYGPRAATSGLYGAVFGTFLAQKLAGKPLTVVGDGSQRRDFTYVTDVAEAFIRAAKSSVRNEIINIGTGKPQRINTLVKLIGGSVVHIPKRPGEPDVTCADITKAKKLLDWSPTIPFEKGVAEMLKNIHLWKDAPVWTPESIKKATHAWFEYL
ncbi:SDR family oxidoreductase [Candidatus Gottesmanbacteria bacterium]|nr:SDR family oxidoreductase [Candidatus Gottesmanbacteria bacterium]